MRRLSLPGCALLLAGVMAGPVHAQRPASTAAVVLEEPRAAPVFPVALVPFTLGSELCQDGGQPVVSLRIYNVLAQPVSILRMRGRRRESIDGLAVRCGGYVAIWDGTINEGTRVAPPGIYYVQLGVVGQRAATRKLIVTQP